MPPFVRIESGVHGRWEYEGLIRAFEWFGRVTGEVLIDNARSALLPQKLYIADSEAVSTRSDRSTPTSIWILGKAMPKPAA